jgi:lipopolysaccharide/colanic/teichoic acid biosynthesis glycosyltransferase
MRIPLLSAEPDRPRPGGVVSRTVDIVGAAVVLAVLAPVLVLAALLIRLTSPGPVVFRQERVGLGERRFTCLKLRTMYTDNDDLIHRRYVQRLLTEARPPEGGGDGVFKLTTDPRITPVGRWLRRTSLDEVPQLVNVLRGEMALVGPRPMLPFELELLQPWQRDRFLVRPGLTGLWQVSGRSRIDASEALRLDVEYARRRSLPMDLAILARTPRAVLRLDQAG